MGLKLQILPRLDVGDAGNTWVARNSVKRSLTRSTSAAGTGAR